VTIGQDDEARDFESLDAQELHMFEEATETEADVSESQFDFPDRVRRNDRHYHFQYTCGIDWTHPSTFLPILTVLGGLLGVVAVPVRKVRRRG
jgi:hypothetical protein